MDRRNFLKLSGLATAPLLLPRLAFAGTGGSRRDTLVVVFLRGGADGLNVVVPYGDSHYYDLRPTLALPDPSGANGVLDLDGYFGMHPALEPLLPAWQAGDLAFVQATGLVDDTRSHFDAQDFMEYGVARRDHAATGWLARHLAELDGEVTTPFLGTAIGNRVPVALRGNRSALGIGSVDGFDVIAPADEYVELRRALAALHGGAAALDGVARDTFDVIDTLQGAVDELPAPSVEYPQSGLGQQLASVAQLIRADVGLEVATIDVGGWDHHDRQAPQLQAGLADVAASLAAFRADLGSGLQNVSLVTMTEFGRRAQENASAGTDHGHGSFMLAMGGGVFGGSVYGSWPGLGPGELYRGDLAITTDYRTVLGELLVKRRETPSADAVFPELTGTGELGLFASR